MFRRLASGAALVATATMLLVGCTPPQAGPTASTNAQPSTPPGPSSAAATARSDEQVAAEAYDLASAFNRLVDRGFRDGALPQTELRAVATPELIEMLQTDLDAFTSRGLRIEGDSALDTPTLVSHERRDARTGTVVLATCMDTSRTSTVDATGEVVSGGVERQPRLFEFEYGADSMVVVRTGPPEEEFDLEGCSP